MLFPGSGSSDMTGWSHGIAYQNLEIIKDSYISGNDGKIVAYSGWDRTGYVPCKGAIEIVFPPMNQQEGTYPSSMWFFTGTKVKLANFRISKTATTKITVPSDAAYFMISSEAEPLADCIAAGIIPMAY